MTRISLIYNSHFTQNSTHHNKSFNFHFLRFGRIEEREKIPLGGGVARSAGVVW